MISAQLHHEHHIHSQEESNSEEFLGQTEQFEAAMQAAASITAENDIASKSLGSMDPLDYNSSGQ
jgi:hypothetical protein